VTAFTPPPLRLALPGSRTSILGLATVAVLSAVSLARASTDNDWTLADHTPGSCTSFTVANRESVFFCNNEDWHDPETYYWVIPSDEDGYGVLCFGYGNLYPQGGINEKGLAFDANALPRLEVRENPDGLKPYQAIVNVILMRQCATVSEAIDLAI
jgi:penicillin V acylase-like amidase (Ntn superfamily)